MPSLSSSVRIAAPLIASLAIAAPLHAQEPASDDSRTTELMGKADSYFHIRRAYTSCRGATGQADIVVCGHHRPDPRYEPPPPPAPADMKSVSLGAATKGAGASVSMRACILQKCPKQLYFIDVAALPEPPPGSDADRIARREMRGR